MSGDTDLDDFIEGTFSVSPQLRRLPLPVVPPGPVVIEVENTGAVRGSLLLINWPPEIVAQAVKPALEFDPTSRAERCWRDRRSGNAYALVREHFALLNAAAQRHSGAVVKTIGDAVMAVFSHPTDAISAALGILAGIDRFNREHGASAIILKVGAHCGPSIAVTLNDNLDYFGQTVNVAARVQSLAEAGEICVSEALYAAPGVRQLLAGHTVVAFDAPLRGVEGTACVYRIRR